MTGARTPGKRNVTVTVAVSRARERLRDAQKQLNWFLWSSELSYGFTMISDDERLHDDDRMVSDALGEVRSQVWYPSTQGSVKYDTNVSTFREQLGRNTVYVYRSVILAWYTYFEHYLEERVRRYVPGRVFGPFPEKLAIPELTGAAFPVEPKIVVLADIIRVIRNQMVHQAFDVLDSVSHSKVVGWRDCTINYLTAKWGCSNAAAIVDDALNYSIALAVREQEKARGVGNDLPLELFYALYAFSNLDKLAFQIEEALLPAGVHESGRISRPMNHINRHDLIVQDGS